MRPRFSLKWLLIAITILSVVFYALFIHPTVIAGRFVSKIESGDLSQLEPLYQNRSGILAEVHGLDLSLKTAKVSAQLQPRTWSDVWQLQRRVFVDMQPPNPTPKSTIFIATLYVTLGYQKTTTADYVGIQEIDTKAK